ncbi:MAG TPA: hypothetical protein VHX18_05910, partial [Rhizomicrobium sp.]|nr:hypothetical protein [Rhizomicrobium sp.]
LRACRSRRRSHGWRGSDQANIAEIDAATSCLFEQHHGDMLRAMGYGGSPSGKGGNAGRLFQTSSRG